MEQGVSHQHSYGRCNRLTVEERTGESRGSGQRLSSHHVER